jgi:hypothetical protein
MNDHHDCETVKDASGSLPNFTVPIVIVFFGLEWPVERPNCIVEIDTMLGDVLPVLGLIPFKFQHPAPSIELQT